MSAIDFRVQRIAQRVAIVRPLCARKHCACARVCARLSLTSCGPANKQSQRSAINGADKVSNTQTYLLCQPNTQRLLALFHQNHQTVPVAQGGGRMCACQPLSYVQLGGGLSLVASLCWCRLVCVCVNLILAVRNLFELVCCTCAR